MRDVPLSPTDGFVLSRVDGVTSTIDLVAQLGLPPSALDASLVKLESLGLITFDSARPSVAPAAPHRSASGPAQAPTDATKTDAEALALAEDVELDPELRLQILAMHRSLERVDHYALLGVERSVDKKGVKRAYYELAAKFHPDKHFRKKLGSFKARLEVVFSRLTSAHDTLASKEKRAEYDAYIDEQERLRGIERILAEGASEAKHAAETAEQQARAAVESKSPSIAPGTSPGMAQRTPVPSVEGAARRDAFARRLLGLRAQSPTSSRPPRAFADAEPSSLTTADAIASLRSRYEERVVRAKTVEAKKYAARAEQSLLAEQVVAAANSYRIAVALAPNDAELARRAQETQAKADVFLGETYARQAQYEEKSGQWPEAARSWGRACKVRPHDADTHARNAAAIVRAGGDLHEAARLALRACELQPADAGHRVTLSNVYLAAGLTQNARRELVTAAKLAPHDDTIEAMVKRLGDIT